MTQMLARRLVRAGAAGLATAIVIATAIDVATAQSSVYQATLAEPNQKTPEVSTEEVRRVLADGSAILVDARKRSEYVAGHIAGAKNAAPEPGSPPSTFVAAVERLVGGDKAKPLVLYCASVPQYGTESAATRLSRWCSIVHLYHNMVQMNYVVK